MRKKVHWLALLGLCLLMGAGSGCSSFRDMFSRKPQSRTPREKLAAKADEGRGPKNQSVTRNDATWMDDLIRTKRYNDTPYLSDSDLNARERKTLEAVMDGDKVGQAEIDRIHRRNEKSAQENHEKIWGSTITSMGKKGTRQGLKEDPSAEGSAK